MRKKEQSIQKPTTSGDQCLRRFHSEVFFNGKLYRVLLLITKHVCSALKYTVVYSISLPYIKIFDLTKDF